MASSAPTHGTATPSSYFSTGTSGTESPSSSSGSMLAPFIYDTSSLVQRLHTGSQIGVAASRLAMEDKLAALCKPLTGPGFDHGKDGAKL